MKRKSDMIALIASAGVGILWASLIGYIAIETENQQEYSDNPADFIILILTCFITAFITVMSIWIMFRLATWRKNSDIDNK